MFLITFILASKLCRVYTYGMNTQKFDLGKALEYDGPYPLQKIAELEAQNASLLEALKEIAKTEGPYSRDPKTHMDNVICNMASIANKAIALVEGDTDG